MAKQVFNTVKAYFINHFNCPKIVFPYLKIKNPGTVVQNGINSTLVFGLTWKEIGLSVPSPSKGSVHLFDRFRKTDLSERDRARVEERVSAEDKKVSADEKDDSVIRSLVHRVNVIDLEVNNLVTLYNC